MQSCVAAALVAAIAVGSSDRVRVSAQHAPNLAGRWTVNRELSQFPREVGFGADMMPAGASASGSTGGGGRGRSRSGGGDASAFSARRESEDDAKRLQQLTAEVRNPSTHLTIVETPTAVAITDDQGQSRTFHPDGREDVLRLGDLPVTVTAKWEAGQLMVLYKVEEGRELRYTYSSTVNPPRLVVDVRFIERGGHDTVRRVYEPAGAVETAPAAAAVPATSAPVWRLPQAASAADVVKTAGPDAELKGLTKLGVVVEDPSPQAAACGLSQSAIETAVSKSLSDAGLTVLRNSDEDTYLYVNVITTSLASGFCVSRYDASLVTHTMAKLSYQDAPVLVEVSLLHKGGLTGGAPAAHAEGVLRSVKQYVDQFATRIRDANKNK
jgi:hypothetical protein